MEQCRQRFWVTHTQSFLWPAPYLFLFISFFATWKEKIDNCIEIYPYIIPFESIALSILLIVIHTHFSYIWIRYWYQFRKKDRLSDTEFTHYCSIPWLHIQLFSRLHEKTICIFWLIKVHGDFSFNCHSPTTTRNPTTKQPKL